MRRGEYSFDAYRVVLADPRFQASFGYSTRAGARDHRRRRAAGRADGLLGAAAPAAAAAGRRVHHAAAAGDPGDRARLRLSAHLQQLLPRSRSRPTSAAPICCSTFSYVTLALPYMYRAVDTGLRAIDVRTLTEAAESLGAGWPTHPLQGDLPQCARRGAQRRLPHLRHRHRRIHHGEPAGPAGLRALSAADRAPTAPMSPRRWRSSPSSSPGPAWA